MDFPIPLMRRARETGDHSVYINGMMGTTNGFESRITHTQERDLPGGANWVVQKFGGTSVGKFGSKIAEDIVMQGLATARLAVVCSARSTNTKSEGTTNRLLRASRHVEEGEGVNEEIIEAIRQDHLAAGRRDVVDHADVVDDGGVETDASGDSEVNGLHKVKISQTVSLCSAVDILSCCSNFGIHANASFLLAGPARV